MQSMIFNKYYHKIRRMLRRFASQYLSFSTYKKAFEHSIENPIAYW
jgi:hypothetical protein